MRSVYILNNNVKCRWKISWIHSSEPQETAYYCVCVCVTKFAVLKLHGSKSYFTSAAAIRQLLEVFRKETDMVFLRKEEMG